MERLDVAAEFQASASRQEHVGDYQIGVGNGQARLGGRFIGDAPDFEAFLAQDALAHPLGVRAIVRQQDAAHS
jgi:hypothetical protein